MRRPARPDFIPQPFWRALEDWEKRVVAFLAAHLDEEFDVKSIKKMTGLARLTSRRLDPLRVGFRCEVPGVSLSSRAIENTSRVAWKMSRDSG